jgi:mannose-6-phosphate isomerase-like protein (cupin superfamily)
MLVRHWHEEPVEELTPLLGRQLLHTETMTIGRILLAAGAIVPSHHHVHEQVANVLAGRLRFVVGGDEQIVSAGRASSSRARSRTRSRRSRTRSCWTSSRRCGTTGCEATTPTSGDKR